MEAQVRTIGEPAAQSNGVQRADRTTRNVSLASAGAVLVALQAISCPLTLILLSFGVGTAWLGDLSALAPYQPTFYALAVAQLGLGYYLVYWKPRKACTKGAASAPLLQTGSRSSPCGAPPFWSRQSLPSAT
jgi:hypothetical protein